MLNRNAKTPAVAYSSHVAAQSRAAATAEATRAAQIAACRIANRTDHTICAACGSDMSRLTPDDFDACIECGCSVSLDDLVSDEAVAIATTNLTVTSGQVALAIEMLRAGKAVIIDNTAHVVSRSNPHALHSFLVDGRCNCFYVQRTEKTCSHELAVAILLVQRYLDAFAAPAKEVVCGLADYSAVAEAEEIAARLSDPFVAEYQAMCAGSLPWNEQIAQRAELMLGR